MPRIPALRPQAPEAPLEWLAEEYACHDGPRLRVQALLDAIEALPETQRRESPVTPRT